MWVKRHERLVKKHYNLYVSLFAWEYIKGSDMNGVFGYDNPRLLDIIDVVDAVFTDNDAMIKYSIEQNAFDESKFKVHYQPVENMTLGKAYAKNGEGKKLRVLWAGRVAAVKLPGLVAEIGKHLDAKKVEIDVFGEINRDVNRNIFDGITAINYCGEYDGFKSLDTDNFDLLLYTSLTDGMPNVVLEAAAAGLPIIASNDGGVGEFVINKKTGLLIDDYLNYKPYIEAIEFAQKNSDLMREYAKNAQDLLVERHGWKKFVDTIEKDIG